LIKLFRSRGLGVLYCQSFTLSAMSCGQATLITPNHGNRFLFYLYPSFVPVARSCSQGKDDGCEIRLHYFCALRGSYLIVGKIN